MRNKSILILEIIWIVTGFICLAAGIRSYFSIGMERVPVFAIMAVICFIFAWLRDRQRKKS